MTVSSLSRRAHARAILVLGLPLIGGHLAQFAIGLTDTVMVGRYGIAELAALTLATSWFFVLFLLGSGFAWAVMPLVASYQAEGNEQKVRRATRMGLWLSGFVFLASMPLLFWSRPIFLLLQQEPELATMAQSYLRIMGWGLLPALGVMVFKSYLAALERTQVIFWITIAAAFLNAGVNYLLIFGKFGLPEMGIAGAAVASLMVQVVSLLAVALYAVNQLPEHALFQRFWRPDPDELANVFRLGLPIGLTTLAEVGLFASSAFLVGTIGEVPLASHGISLQLATAAFMIHMGLSNAATVRAGAAFGRGDVDGLKRGAFVASLCSVIVALVASTVFLLIPETLMSLFLDADEPQRDAIIGIGVGLLALAAVFQLFDGAQVVILGVLRGVQDTKVPMILAVVSYWLVGMPASYVFGFVLGWGAVGVWVGLVLSLVVAGGSLIVRFWGAIAPRLTQTRQSSIDEATIGQEVSYDDL